MIAKLLIFINLLISFQLFGQGFKTVEIEKNQIDSNNKIYRPGLQFVFNLEITLDNETVFLKLNNDRTYELLGGKTESTVSKILMTIAKPKDKEKTNKKQTEIFYSYENTRFLASSTGLVENDKNIWIHPPRDSFFSILELFPFPYIKLGNTPIFKWTDKLLIDERWSNELIGSWKGKLETELEYKIVNQADIETKFGNIQTQLIEATAKSKFGINSLRAYYSDDFGFVNLEYKSEKNMTIKLELIEVNEIEIFTSVEEFLMKKNK